LLSTLLPWAAGRKAEDIKLSPPGRIRVGLLDILASKGDGKMPENLLQITGIKGSPRSESNSSRLLEEVLTGCDRAAEKTDQEIIKNIIKPDEREISACIACFHCDRTGECIFRDDMPELIKTFNRSDIIIVASPIFFNGMPSTLKKMIDRCQPIWASKYRLKRPIIDRHKKRRGLLLGCAGAPEYQDQFTALKTVGEMFFKTINTRLLAKKFIPNTDNLILEQESELLDEFRKLGEKLVEEFARK